MYLNARNGYLSGDSRTYDNDGRLTQHTNAANSANQTNTYDAHGALTRHTNFKMSSPAATATMNFIPNALGQCSAQFNLYFNWDTQNNAWDWVIDNLNMMSPW